MLYDKFFLLRQEKTSIQIYSQKIIFFVGKILYNELSFISHFPPSHRCDMPEKTTIEKIMTRGVFTVTLDNTVFEADRLMKDEKIRHLPVVDEKKFIGLITERTIMEYTLRQLYEFDESYGETGQNRIGDYREIMTRDVRIIYPEDSVMKACELMAKYKIDCLPVVDWQHNLMGILTSIDLLLFFYKGLKENLAKSK